MVEGVGLPPWEAPVVFFCVSSCMISCGLPVQGITGSYTLRYKLQDEVDDIQDLGQTLSADVNAVHSLVEFQNVHPIYLGAKQLVCCDVVDLVGNLWLSMFMAGWFSVVLAVAMFLLHQAIG